MPAAKFLPVWPRTTTCGLLSYIHSHGLHTLHYSQTAGIADSKPFSLPHRSQIPFCWWPCQGYVSDDDIVSDLKRLLGGYMIRLAAGKPFPK